MLIVPAIDLLGGKVVRLHRGSYDEVTVFDTDPVARAKRFRAEGAERLHVVDLDGARAGRCVQEDVIRAIVLAFGAGVQVGGGVRTREAADGYFACGAERVVLGTAALRDREMVRALCKDFPKRVIVAVDAKGGMVATDGWTSVSETRAVDLARAFSDVAVGAILYTDVARDGTRSGPDVARTAALARETGLSVIASGGIGSLDDLRELAKHPGVDAAIVGRAIYDEVFTLTEAIAAASS
ncbi:MAG TPA: 1-(5-phosphoribosyl)-5-[(5-phosphoribosylamino)methylideneamino]imidazole-4-carboxamide isomerase [Polyangiaceae bacterium]|jgi:phosphoribosylformimino-5-aminoimidazole carboxamide ribotide isomerase|nr:1-(5-phosphoribosyl)-5-[(5-phosphoribosylamino)methylideneamino]imidazole-4-carboxamide isomerase [Polyangiaceae bacterium]